MFPRILVIDDDPNWREQFKDMLVDLGFEADTAAGIMEAKPLLSDRRYALILLDVVLNKPYSALSVQQSWATLHRNHPDLPIVATTGEPLDPEEAFTLSKFGAIDFIFKPKVQLPDFRRRILDILQKAPASFQDAHALVIGVGGYLHSRFPDLPATVRDAEALAAILTDSARCGYPPSNVQLITGKQATVVNIRAALKSLAQPTNTEPTVLIYFSGHGGRRLENGIPRVYLCAHEADPDNLADSTISGDEFSELLAAIHARKLLVILDACHAGGAAEFKSSDGTVIWKAGLPNSYYEALAQGSGRVAIASSKEDQLSRIRRQGDLSLFTWYLLEGLRGAAAVSGDGFVRVLNLFNYVSQQVKNDQPDQEPVLHAKGVDENFPIALAPT